MQGWPDPAPRTENFPEGDYGTLRWLKHKSLALVDPTGGDRPPPCCLLVELIDKDKPATDHSNIRVICPPSLYASVVELYHTRGHWGVQKTVEAIRRQYTWRNLYSQVAKFITHRCAICVEKQRVDLKQGVHAPCVLHDQGEVVYVDLLGPFSNSVSRAHYLLSMMDGFSCYVVVFPVEVGS